MTAFTPDPRSMAGHPNKVKMTAAVQGWIAAAQGRPNARNLLLNQADVVERLKADLLRTSLADRPCAADLEGLTAFDLSAAHADLMIAANSVGRVAA